MIGVGLVQPPASREANILHGLLHDRIARLWKQRDLHDDGRRGCPECDDHMLELHALVRLARQARRQAEADTVWRVGRGDPVTASKAADWSEAEKREAWGR